MLDVIRKSKILAKIVSLPSLIPITSELHNIPIQNTDEAYFGGRIYEEFKKTLLKNNCGTREYLKFFALCATPKVCSNFVQF